MKCHLHHCYSTKKCQSSWRDKKNKEIFQHHARETAFQSRSLILSSSQIFTPPLGVAANLDVSDAVPSLSTMVAFVLDAAHNYVNEMQNIGKCLCQSLCD
jgi:hypothetical protein